MKRRSAVTFLPRRTSITSSVGTRTSSIWSSSPCSATLVWICSAIFFSKFERTLTEYQRFAMLSDTPSPAARKPKVSNYSRRFTRDLRKEKRRATRFAARPSGKLAANTALRRRIQGGIAAFPKGSAEGAQHPFQPHPDEKVHDREEGRHEG